MSLIIDGKEAGGASGPDKKINSLKGLLEKHAKNRIEQKVVRTIAIKPEWQHFADEIKKMKFEMKAILRRKEAAENLMWAEIELDLQTDESMRLDLDKNLIEVYETESDELKKKIEDGEVIKHGNHYHDSGELLDDLEEHLDLDA